MAIIILKYFFILLFFHKVFYVYINFFFQCKTALCINLQFSYLVLFVVLLLFSHRFSNYSRHSVHICFTISCFGGFPQLMTRSSRVLWEINFLKLLFHILFIVRNYSQLVDSSNYFTQFLVLSFSKMCHIILETSIFYSFFIPEFACIFIYF